MDLNPNGVRVPDFLELEEILRVPTNDIDYEMGEMKLDDLASWIDEQTIDDVPTASPVGAIVDDYESIHAGQWKQLEDLSRTGNRTIKTEIDSLWNEMAANPAFGVSIWSFRKTFADFIEQKCWRDIDVTDNYPGSMNVKKASIIVKQLHNEVKEKLRDVNVGVLPATPDFRMQLQKWDEDFTHNYSAYPLDVVNLMQQILTKEQQIIATKQSQDDAGTGWPGTAVNAVPQNMFIPGGQEAVDEKVARSNEITRVISELEQRNQSGAAVINNLIQRVQQLQVWTDENLAVIDRYDIDQLNPQLQKKWREIKLRRDGAIQEKKRMVNDCHIQPLENLKNVLSLVLNDALGEWQRDQAYINNGKIVTTICTIQQLENWCKRLAKLVNNNLHQMSELQRLDQALGPASAHVFISQQYGKGTQEQVQINAIDWLSQEYANLLKTIVEKGLVVEKHPPQVLMKDKRFQCQLRHLVGDSLDIHQVPFDVEAWLLNAEQAMSVLEGGHVTGFGYTGKILNSTARSDFIDHLRQLSVNMRNMCLKMQQRGANRNAEMVAELKFVMLFRARISLRFPSPNQPISVVAQTMSLPIVVISHGKQEADAQATIFWDNAFAKMGRKPFDIDESVPWEWMLKALDCRWKKECEENGKAVGLSKQAQDYLTMKLFNEKKVPNGTMISWKKFNHDKMFQCGDTRRELFTFWTWFFKAMELISSVQVKKYWNAGIIHGFLSKGDCQRMLQENGIPGVFLFRFSETKLGALSISCYRNLNGKPMVCNLEPDILKNFIVRSLPDMVFDLEYLHYLYPDHPKDSIFGSFRAREDRKPIRSPTDYWGKEFKVATKDEDAWHVQPPDLHVKPPSPNGFPTDMGAGDHLAMDDNSSEN